MLERVHTVMHVLRSEDNLQYLVLFFYQMDLKDLTQVITFGSKARGFTHSAILPAFSNF